MNEEEIKTEIKKDYKRRCHAQYMRNYYRMYPEKKVAWKNWFKKYRKENEAYRKKFRDPSLMKLREKRKDRYEFITRIKTSPCMDCGVQYNPWVMQFDHRPGENKIADITFMASSSVKFKTLEEEVKKCDVVCANCHSERTHQRKKEKQRTGH